MDLIKPLILIVCANAMPVVLHTLFGDRMRIPLDGGKLFFDGRPVFGNSKTLRGLLGSLLVTTAIALLLDLPPAIGLLIATGAMAGDLFSSFVKRRLGMRPSSQAIGLDQIPEALFPLLLVMQEFQLSITAVLSATLIFVLLEMTLSPLLHKLHLRDTPY